MTAEIAVMNKHGIALAADSAVTVRSRNGANLQGPKIRVSANKIFTLSKYHPVAVMIYNNAEIMGVPWETVIKAYRRQLGTTAFPRIADYVENFVTYLAAERRFFPAELQRASVESYVQAYFQTHFLLALNQQAEQRFAAGEGSLSPAQVKAMLEGLIRNSHDRWLASDLLPGLPPDCEQRLESAYGALFDAAIKDAFGRLPPLTRASAKLLAQIPRMIYTRVPPGFNEGIFVGGTGVVFAGYGTEDVFPSFREIVVDEVIDDRLLWWPHRDAEISRVYPASVCAFAQEDMARTFMEGVDPRYQGFLEASLGEILVGFTREIFAALPKGQPSKRARDHIESARAAMLGSYVAKLGEERQARFVNTVVDSVQSLPLDDLAEMAESLVNLTSLKRKVSMDDETVSGPIDVAVISSGDGFIWINRKHYFSRDRNPQFFANYYREEPDATSDEKDPFPLGPKEAEGLDPE